MPATSHTAPTDDDIDRAAEVLRRGGLVVFPTETVYGIGASIERVDAVTRIFEAKGRPPARAMTVHLGTEADPDEWAVDVPEQARRLTRRHWPGPLTVVLRSRPHVPEVVRGGAGTVGLRVPDQPVALRLLDRFVGGVVATSANRHGRASPTTADDAMVQLGDHVDAVLDDGPCRLGVDSTVVDLTTNPPRILRVGALPVDAVERAVEGPVEVAW